jgi:hypothetical protein
MRRVLLLSLGVAVAGVGTLLAADDVAAWRAFAPLANITKAGDGLGQIPLIQAIIGAFFSAAVLGVGLALTLGAALTRTTPIQPELAGLARFWRLRVFASNVLALFPGRGIIPKHS